MNVPMYLTRNALGADTGAREQGITTTIIIAIIIRSVTTTTTMSTSAHSTVAGLMHNVRLLRLLRHAKK
ncbi:hypothetical protein CTA1_950 [Colletotrichum tanaceti]|uniref:Uncharacterized protein n=1 Tax=Colletotrichum tanaceti TaxID=1306861 RepID=A0A4U6WZY2_9PEZI|nr:hypothetical protein CTA1_950 [Colletotrichum tanaceti]